MRISSSLSFAGLHHRCAPLVVVLLLLATTAHAQSRAASSSLPPRAQVAPLLDAPDGPAADDLEGVVFRPLPPRLAARPLAGLPARATACSLDPAVVAMMNQAGNVLDVELPLGAGATVVARLRRFEVVAPDATLVDEGPGGVRSPLAITVSTWTGHLLDDPDADVFLGLSPSQAQGWITTRGTTFLIATRPTPAGPLTLAYDQLDFHVPDALTPASCAGAILAPGQTTPPPTGDAGYASRVACKAFRVAVDTDEEFAARAGGGQNAADFAVILVAATNVIYTRDIGMGLRLSFLRIWSTTDPWTAGNTSAQLAEFLAYWQANMASVSRASAHLLSGRGLGGGIAYVRNACSSGYGYAVSANLAASFPFPIQDNASSNWDLMVVAHEWGHQFGTGHTHNVCEYNPIIDACGLRASSEGCEFGDQDCSVAAARAGTIMSYCHTCSGGTANMKMTFGPRVIARITEYVNTLACAATLESPSLASIALSPAGLICPNSSVTLVANASGTELRFQWYRNGNRVLGATNASHTVASPVNNDRWDVMVYSPCGVILTQGTTAGVTLAVGGSGPSITSQPASVTRCPGESVTFTVAATGATSLQWRRNGAAIQGAVAASYTVASVVAADAATYDCVVANASCGVATSSATLTVDTGPTLTQQPVTATACLTQPVQISVVASGVRQISYRWQVRDLNAPGGWRPIDDGPVIINGIAAATAVGAASPTLSLADLTPAWRASTVVNARGVRCEISGACPGAPRLVSASALVYRCPADLNCDGGIDGADINAFYARWEIGDQVADVNFDGGVDGADVGEFFSLWQSGGC
ncbi:MAG: M12 family metallo-peptidase [Phycisphaerae bacterium]